MSISIFGSDYNFIRTSLDNSNGEEICSQVKYTSSYVTKVNQTGSKVNLPEEKNSTSSLEPFVDFFNSIYLNKIPLRKNTGILPPGLLYLTNEYVIFERPPCYQNVSIIPRQMDDIEYRRKEEILYRLPIPWQLYFVKYSSVETEDGIDLYTSDVKMFFTSGPVASFEDNIYLAPLTNFYTNGDLCRPIYSQMEDIERYTKDVAGVIKAAYDWVWNSGTNFDLTSCVVQYYMQMRDQKDVSIFNKSEDKAAQYENTRKFHFGSYYCNLTELNYLYLLWEKFDLDEVINLNWPNPLNTKALHNYIETVQNDRMFSYIQEHSANIDEEYWHYDEENSSPYQCGETSCECMGGGEIDMNDFLKWAGAWPPPPVTVSTSFASFILDTTDKSMIAGMYLSSEDFYTHMRSSMRDIMLYA